MELWIKSQNKAKICKVSALYLDTVTYGTVVGISKNRNLYLGNYESDQRAEEILDELSKLINSTNIDKVIVYQMPKE